MALKPEALITFNILQTLLGLSNDDQEMAELMINQATALAEKRTKRKLKARDYQDNLFDGTGKKELLFSEYPINSISIFQVNDVDLLSEIRIYKETGLIKMKSGVFPLGDQNIQITANAGFELIPDDLQQAIVEIVAWNLKRIRGRGIGIRSESADGVNIGMEIEVPLNAARILMDYSRVI